MVPTHCFFKNHFVEFFSDTITMEIVLRPIFSVLTVPELKIKRNVDFINSASDPVGPHLFVGYLFSSSFNKYLLENF